MTCFVVVKAAVPSLGADWSCLFQELIDIKMAQCRRVVNGGCPSPAGDPE